MVQSVTPPSASFCVSLSPNNKCKLVSSQSEHVDAEVCRIANSSFHQDLGQKYGFQSSKQISDASRVTDSVAQRVQHPHVEATEKHLHSTCAVRHMSAGLVFLHTFSSLNHVLNPETSDFDMTPTLVATRQTGGLPAQCHLVDESRQ